MAKIYGYAGKILRVDLTDKTITENSSTKYLPKFFGGRGLAAKIYWDEIPPEVGALDPENKLIFTTGPLTGTGVFAPAISTCVSKSPMIYPTPTSYCACAGGRWGHELKYAGYDAIIVQGKAESPVYIWINNGHTEIRDADSLWGRTTRQTREELMLAHGSKVQVACIGPAGENMVIPSVIIVDCNTAFGQGGFGAVMGSKNLKAIVIRGTGRIEVANPQKILETNKQINDLMSIKVGETKVVEGQPVTGTWPTPNIWNVIDFIPGNKLRTEQKLGLTRIRQSGCPGCLRMCKAKVEFTDRSLPSGTAECGDALMWMGQENEYYGGAPIGRVLWEWSMLGDELGLDHFYTGCMGFGYPVPFSKKSPGASSMTLDMWREAYKRGILTEENTGLPWAKFGSQEFLRQFLRMIAYREGFGDVLAQGAGAVAKYIMEHEEFGPNRKEAEFLYQKTYPKAGRFGGINRHCLCGGYGVGMSHAVSSFYSAVSFKRGKEVHGVQGTQPKEWLLKWFGTDKIQDPTYWGEDIATATIVNEHYCMEVDSAPCCAFNSQIENPLFMFDTVDKYLKISPHGTPEYWSAVFGEDITHDDLMKRYEMLVNLERAIWVRDGYTEDKFDTYFDCIFDEEDSEGHIIIPKDKFEALLPVYYKMRGWKDGVPTRAKLEELDLKDVADELEAMGKLPA